MTLLRNLAGQFVKLFLQILSDCVPFPLLFALFPLAAHLFLCEFSVLSHLHAVFQADGSISVTCTSMGGIKRICTPVLLYCPLIFSLLITCLFIPWPGKSVIILERSWFESHTGVNNFSGKKCLWFAPIRAGGSVYSGFFWLWCSCRCHVWFLCVWNRAAFQWRFFPPDLESSSSCAV